MLFLLTVKAILVNELPRKMIRYQVIIFTQWIKQVKASFTRQSECCCWAAENFPCGFDLDYKYLDSGHTRPSFLKKREGRFPANNLLYGLEIFVAAAVIKGITCVALCYNNKSNHRAGISLHQSIANGPAMEKWIMFVLTHSANFNPRGIFVGCSDHFTDECYQMSVHVEGFQRSIIPLSIRTIWKNKIRK